MASAVGAVGEVLAAVVAVLVAAGFALLAVDDVRTSTVIVGHARRVTAVAVIGLGLAGIIDRNWTGLVTAAASALLITGIQLVPYALQARRGGDRIGRADVRLSAPFGWTLGYYGTGFAFVGFAAALVAGLVASLVARRRRIPFIPFMTLGLVVGLMLALLGSRT